MNLTDYAIWTRANPDKIPRLLQVESETITDGLGLRMSLYLAGCTHRCPGCHNQTSWAPDQGQPLDATLVAKIIAEFKNNPLLDGVTFTGGDPLYNPEGFYQLLSTIKTALPDVNLWLYSGYRFEAISNIKYGKEILALIDILVDGRFEQSLYLPDLAFRGSLNQKIIDVQKSLKNNCVIEVKMDSM